MYFKTVKPEEVGIKSSYVQSLLEYYEKNGLAMHSVVMARGDKIFCEAYWQPFKAADNHRMYSQTKSYVGIAVAQLAQEGKINLDDKIIDYFPERLPETVHPYLAAQTIKNMLNMQTCFSAGTWFNKFDGDRIKAYFHLEPTHYPGTTFYYDSTGSLVLGALVEKVTGKTFLEYLREKCLNEIGFSKSARVLTIPSGFAWGDSALLCRPTDMLLFGRLLANKGEWQGKQLLNKAAVTDATNTEIYNGVFGTNTRKQGYGYQIWGTHKNSFAFFGMHGQFTIYNPETDILFISTAGYQMEDTGYAEKVFDGFFDNIVAKATDKLSGTDKEYNSLTNYISGLKLLTAKGSAATKKTSEINGKRFIADKNPMGITEFTLNFTENGGEFNYINAQGKKSIKFGMSQNIFQPFPEENYPKDIGGIECKGNMYKCAASAAWIEEEKLSILVQIIDDYIGILDITVGFNGEVAVIEMKKSAEYFLEEYSGYLTAK